MRVRAYRRAERTVLQNPSGLVREGIPKVAAQTSTDRRAHAPDVEACFAIADHDHILQPQIAVMILRSRCNRQLERIAQADALPEEFIAERPVNFAWIRSRPLSPWMRGFSR